MKKVPLIPKEIPPWINDPDDRKDYVAGWKARVDEQPKRSGPAAFNSRWYNGWADADKDILGERRGLAGD
jgi:ribosome modulation factor